MGGPPAGGMSPRPIRSEGMSRVVPVVVSAGLAVGVFCGLLFGLGTGKRNAVADTTKASNGVKRVEEPTVDPDSINTPRPKPAIATPPSAGSGSALAAAGSAGSAAGVGAASAAPAANATKIVVEVKPEAAAQIAKVYIDGKEITGTTADIPLAPGTTKQKVKVAVKAPGFKDVEQDVEAEGESTTLKFELAKGRTSPAATATSEPGATAGGGGTAGGSTGGNAGGGTANSGSTSGGNAGGGSTSGTKPTGGSKPAGKKPGKGSALIDI